MTGASSEFQAYFHVNASVLLGINLPSNEFCEASATISAVSGNILHLKLTTDTDLTRLPAEAGTNMIVKTSDAWCICRSECELLAVPDETDIQVMLKGPLNIQQRREYFREDVLIPMLWNVPEAQQLPVVRQEWELARIQARSDVQPVLAPCRQGFKVIHWRKRVSIKPVRINLSGSGLSLPTTEPFVPGTLVNLQLFIPFNPPRVIVAVGAVIRSFDVSKSGKTSHMTALHFEFLDERDRDTIISYLFMEQRNLLRQKADERADEALPPTEPEEVE